MGLFIEPGTETVEVAGESLEIKVLTGRERLAVLRHYLKIAKLIEGKDDEEELSNETTLDIQDANYKILKIGLPIDPDTINPKHWGTIVSDVWKANTLGGDDAKN